MSSDGDRWHNIQYSPARPDSLASNLVTSAMFDSVGQLWVSTEFGLDRLISLDVGVAKFEHVSDMHGGNGENFGSCLMEDQLGRIWSNRKVFDRQKRKSMT